jgi:hypothetical protein
MKEDDLFVLKYISLCAKNGKVTLDEARRELQEIDAFLSEADEKKLRRRKLVKVLEHYGEDLHRNSRATDPSVDVEISSDPEMIELCSNIIQAMKDHWKNNPGKSMSIRDINIAVNGYDKHALVIRAVKYLGEQEVFERDESNGIKPGPKFQQETQE